MSDVHSERRALTDAIGDGLPPQVTDDCPQCGITVRMTPYDVGDGPEMHCLTCDWCWEAPRGSER